MPDHGKLSTLPLPLSGLGLKPCEAVILAELVRLLDAKQVPDLGGGRAACVTPRRRAA